jgi:flagellar hook-associated protein 1 FlgK
MSLLNVGSRALLSNQIALQTAGHNIANVSVPGYSRQRAELTTENGQYTSAGYIGKGVNVQTIQRSYDAFLTKQATLASTLQAGDSTRSDYLKKLGDLFPTGSNGLGASINTMLNAFSDVASAPTDLTARTVALTQIDETASRMRTASQGIDELQSGIQQSLRDMVRQVNSLAQGIADVNRQITRTQGSGQPPNDLLDRRDQLIRELNGYVQTSSIPADDGSVGVFIAGSQALVLGTDVATLGIGQDDFGDRLGSKLTMSRPGTSVTLDEDNLGGGKMSGLLRFQNTDLTEGRNLLGRLTTAVTTAVNDQHRLGLDLDGKVGINLFSPTVFTPDNILQPTAPATLNTGNAVLNLSIADTSQFAASNYEVLFTSATTGSIIRKSDGLSTSFPQSPAPTAPILATLDGLNISMPSGTPAAGDRYLLKPFSTAAGAIQSQLASPRGLAVSNPLAASVSPTNQGTLSIVSLRTQTQASTAALPIDNHSVKFSVTAGVATYTIFDTTNSTVAGGPFSYVTGQTITHAPPGFTGFSLTLKGLPANNDTIQIQQNPYPTLNAGNASAIMALRDKPMFDGAPLSDGYASLIGQLGVRANSAELAANVSASIATSTEQSRASLSGVNLDEEAASLIQYQQAYQASAKIIQVAQGIFDSLLQAVSR